MTQQRGTHTFKVQLLVLANLIESRAGAKVEAGTRRVLFIPAQKNEKSNINFTTRQQILKNILQIGLQQKNCNFKSFKHHRSES